MKGKVGGAAGVPKSKGLPAVNLLSYQQTYFNDPSWVRMLTGGRGAGKTYAMAASLVAECRAGRVSAFVPSSMKSGAELIGRLAPDTKLSGLDACFSFPSGGALFLVYRGPNVDLERLRGLNLDRISIDSPAEPGLITAALSLNCRFDIAIDLPDVSVHRFGIQPNPYLATLLGKHSARKKK